MKQLRNKGYTVIELMIVGAIGLIIVAGLFGMCTTTKQKTNANALARTWVDQMYPDAQEVNITCQGYDSDQDSYVSCTVRVDKELIALECASIMTEMLGSGCRLPKPGARVYQ